MQSSDAPPSPSPRPVRVRSFFWSPRVNGERSGAPRFLHTPHVQGLALFLPFATAGSTSFGLLLLVKSRLQKHSTVFVDREARLDERNSSAVGVPCTPSKLLEIADVVSRF